MVTLQTEAFARGDMRAALHQSFLALDELLENPACQAELFALNQVCKMCIYECSNQALTCFDQVPITSTSPLIKTKALESCKCVYCLHRV